MSAAEIAGLLAALGVGAVIPRIVDGLIGLFTGRHDAERARYRDLVAERDAAERYADQQASMRRRISEHASHLRRILLDSGVEADSLPPWPIPPGSEKENQNE